MPLDGFAERVMSGDEFHQWALRFGRPLIGGARALALRESLLPNAPWPDFSVNFSRARTLVRRAEAFRDIGDPDAFQEGMRAGLTQLARGVLLAHHVFPRSRPELPSQLRGVGEAALAEALEAFEPGIGSSLENAEAAIRFARQELARRRAA